MKKSDKNNNEKLLENNFICSTKIACEFFGISRESLSTWEKKGAPKESRGRWDLKKLMEWRYKGENMEAPSVRKLKAEAEIKESKAKQEKIKLAVIERKYLPISEVKDELTRMCLNLKKSMLAVGHNAASELAVAVGLEAAEIARKEIDKRIKEALEEVSKYGSYSPKRKKTKPAL
ncbi:MAG: hypothetical protein II767_13290 [Proteobacteria bacterium]|nr:hypothetical protein [Pseudomonadota bacterium]